MRNGTAFNNQPTYADNPTARARETANQQGDWWIGTFEHRPFIETVAGSIQGDGPQGILTSPSFDIIGKYISFLIGGSCDINLSRAELIVGGQVGSTCMSHLTFKVSLKMSKMFCLHVEARFRPLEQDWKEW